MGVHSPLPIPLQKSVKLVSAKGQEYEVAESVALGSKLIKDMLEQNPGGVVGTISEGGKFAACRHPAKLWPLRAAHCAVCCVCPVYCVCLSLQTPRTPFPWLPLRTVSLSWYGLSTPQQYLPPTFFFFFHLRPSVPSLHCPRVALCFLSLVVFSCAPLCASCSRFWST